MKNYLLILFCALTAQLTFGQTPPKEYYDLVEKAYSLYKAKDYKNSASTYFEAFKTFGGMGFLDDRWTAACSWALAGIADSAFFNIERIATRADYTYLENIAADSDFTSLRKDPRWQSFLKTIRENKDKAEANWNKPLIHLLDSIVKEDQKWRHYISKFQNGELGTDTISRETITRNIMLCDSLNYFTLKLIFGEYGFPNTGLIGEKGSSNFWLLVQHQDMHPKFQDSVLTAMKKEVDNKKASGRNYAYLVDRVKMNTGQLQVYGTQMTLKSDSTSFEPLPVIQPDKLNERRLSVGLDSIESYIEIMNSRNSGSLKKK